MATPQLLTKREFTTSRYGELAEQSDVNVNDVIVAAEEAIQRRIDRQLAPATYVETYRATGQTLFVVNRPIIDVITIRRRSSFLSGWQEITNFRVQGGPDYIEVFDTIHGFDVEVTYDAGFTVTPHDIKQAIILQVALFLQQDIEFYGAGDGKEPGITYAYKDIDRLLEPYSMKSSVWR